MTCKEAVQQQSLGNTGNGHLRHANGGRCNRQKIRPKTHDVMQSHSHPFCDPPRNQAALPICTGGRCGMSACWMPSRKCTCRQDKTTWKHDNEIPSTLRKPSERSRHRNPEKASLEGLLCSSNFVRPEVRVYVFYGRDNECAGGRTGDACAKDCLLRQ